MSLQKNFLRKGVSRLPLLALGLVLAFSSSVRVVAQPITHTATAAMLALFDQPELVSGKPGKGETKAEQKSEQDEANIYRHSAVVEWFSKVFHLDIEFTARLFEYINFAVILLALGIPLIKVLPKVLRKRKESLSLELQTAQVATESANKRMSAVEEKLKGLDAEVAAIRKQVEEDIRGDEARAKAAIEEETARIVAAAEQEIGMAATLARRSLKRYSAELAIDGAMKKLTMNADTDRALFAEFARDSTPAQAGSAKNGSRN